jgi:hypothetical protein
MKTIKFKLFKKKRLNIFLNLYDYIDRLNSEKIVYQTELLLKFIK